MENQRHTCNTYKSGWFIIMFINFLFGISGMTVCSLKLKYSEEDIQKGFFKISLIFALCNLFLSVFLLAAIIKNSQKCAFVYTFLSFLNLFTAVLYIETNTTANTTFIIIFSLFACVCLIWLCIYGAYQLFVEDTLRSSSLEEISL